MRYLTSFFIVILSVTMSVVAQKNGTSSITYSLPKTVMNIEIKIEKTTQQPGVFYRYAERYLATKDIISEEKMSYQIKSIDVFETNIPDSARTFTVQSDLAVKAKLSLDESGIIRGFNLPVVASQPKFVKQSKLFEIHKNVNKRSGLLPLGEEYMMAGSEAKLAEGAAKQIYRIRESRLSLLTADVEKMPSDGASLRTMLDEMSKMEDNLTELFVGKKTVESFTETIRLIPESGINEHILFRFSTLKGLVQSNDLSGTPYFISIQTHPNDFKSGSKNHLESKSNLYTVVPAVADLSITDGTKKCFEKQFVFPQFGELVAMPDEIGKNQNLKVRIDTKTGRLLSIE